MEEPIKQEEQEVSTNEVDTSELDKIKTELEEYKDRYIRLCAEFDNFRKRTIKEKEEFSKMANENTFKSILPIIDNFERAFSSTITEDGIKLIYQSLINTMGQKGLVVMDVIGQEFNPDLHEAITQTPSTEELKGKVVEVLENGYYLQGKVIRFAKVIVGC